MGLLTKIRKADVIAYPELGTESIMRLEVEDFPVVVVNDVYGEDLYRIGLEKYKEVAGVEDESC